MKKTKFAIFLLAFILILPSVLVSASENNTGIKPVLRYANAGTFDLWTEESYYSSPVVTDLDGDGKKEIIFSNYSITVLNAADGSVKFKVNSGHDRNTPVAEFDKSVGNTWCNISVTDINADGKKEIISVHSNGLISVLDNKGYFVPGWPQNARPGSPAKALCVEDLDGDGKYEIIVGYGVESSKSVYVYDCSGKLLDGWPQLSDANKPYASSYGVFMSGISASDIDGDGKKEIIVPTDTSFVSAYKPDGSLVMANDLVYGTRAWGRTALYEDYNIEVRGDNGSWGFDCVGGEPRETLYKAEFGHGISTVKDIDGDGKKEIIVTGIMCNRKYISYPPTEYMTVFILNADRTRYINRSLDADWSTPPVDLGLPLLQNEKSIASKVCQTPVVEDLDGDGKVEILFNSYNGKVHCFSIDKTEKYAWPYSLTKRSSPLFEYASPVVCRDLDGDGKKEVIFCSYYDEDGELPGIVQGSLYILNCKGQLVSKTTLPKAKEPDNKNNGSMNMPVVSDIDGDGKYEIVINTLNGAICVYDL